MGGQGVEYRGSLSGVAALRVQRRERHRGIDLARVGREELLERVDGGGESGSERARVRRELLHGGGQRCPLARHRLGPRRRIAGEQLLVRRCELRFPRFARLRRGHEARQHRGVVT